MIRRYRHLQKDRGFTLLEVMVVVAVISVILTMAILSIGNAGRGDKLVDAARRLQLVSELGSQHAVMTGKPVGVIISGPAYNFQVYDQGNWQPAHARGLKAHEFETGIWLEATDHERSDQASTPSMMFLPDGENLLRSIAVYDEFSDQSISLIPIAGVYDIVQNGIVDE